MDWLRCKKYILENFAGKRVEEKVLRKSMKIEDYELYSQWMHALVEEAVIRPIKKSGPNGLKPPLHKRYQVARIDNVIGDYSEEIRCLHPVFNIEGYLENQQRYLMERKIILEFNRFIRSENVFLEDPASVNERSFQIFGKEKFMSKDCKTVLSFNAELEAYLKIYHTPEPFFEYGIADEFNTNEINVLIIENKDTWYTLKKIMNRTANILCGIRFDSLLYGEGKKITRRRYSLTEFAKTYYEKGEHVRFYYFGDLDMEGIEIFENLIRNNSQLEIALFKVLYLDMLDEAKDRDMPDSSKLQHSSDGKVFFSNFTESQINVIKNLLDGGKYVPQEILTYGFLKRKVEKDI